MKKEVREAMKRAKELEDKPILSMEQIVAVYKEGMEEAEKLRKLLTPEWFVKDVHGKAAKKPVKKVKKKKAKKAKKRRSPTRKKKSL